MKTLRIAAAGLISVALVTAIATPAIAAETEPTTITTFGYVPEDDDTAPLDDVLDAVEDDGLGTVNSDETEASSLSLNSSAATTAATNPYKVKDTWKDNKARTVVVRYGTTNGFGWEHAKPHNVTMTMIKKTTQFPKTRDVSATTTVYRTPAIEWECWLATCHAKRSMTVRVVIATQVLSDKIQKGLITAYCLDAAKNVCPAWVVRVAG